MNILIEIYKPRFIKILLKEILPLKRVQLKPLDNNNKKMNSQII